MGRVRETRDGTTFSSTGIIVDVLRTWSGRNDGRSCVDGGGRGTSYRLPRV